MGSTLMLRRWPLRQQRHLAVSLRPPQIFATGLVLIPNIEVYFWSLAVRASSWRRDVCDERRLEDTSVLSVLFFNNKETLAM